VNRKFALLLPIFALACFPTHCHAGTVPCQAFSLSINNYYASWPTVPFCSKRLWDTGATWKNINPSYGNYYWTWLDSLMLQASQHGADTVFTFGVVPPWASTNPGLTGCGYGNGTCAPPVLSYWTTFIDALTRHSAANKAAGKGHIGAYELWNEPNATNWWRCTPQQMVALAQAAYAIIKQNDPSAIVISPAPQGIYGWRWTDSYFAVGGAKYADVVGMHGYLPRGTSQPESYFSFLITNTKAVMNQYGVGARPIWDMEGNWTADTNLPSYSQQAAFLARSYILRLFNNVQRFYWYSWDNQANGTLWSSSGGIRPAGTAFGQVSNWLVGATLGSCSTAGSVWTCNISRSNGYLGLLVWNQTGSSTYAASSIYKHYRDIAGGVHSIGGSITIGQQPFLLENN
jgi:Cellulase (glycosyl hydrolase family 5)